jgi:hypothetical protein
VSKPRIFFFLSGSFACVSIKFYQRGLKIITNPYEYEPLIDDGISDFYVTKRQSQFEVYIHNIISVIDIDPPFQRSGTDYDAVGNNLNTFAFFHMHHGLFLLVSFLLLLETGERCVPKKLIVPLGLVPRFGNVLSLHE